MKQYSPRSANRSSGMTVVELISVAALIGILAYLSAGSVTQLLGFQKRIDFEEERQWAIRTIVRSIDCDDTFKQNNIDRFSPGVNCDSTTDTVVGPYLRLRGKRPDGSNTWLTQTPLQDNAYWLGNLLVRATCSKSENSLIVRVGYPGPKGNGWVTDPLRKDAAGKQLPFDWSHPLSTIFSRKSFENLPLCSAQKPSGNFERRIVTYRATDPTDLPWTTQTDTFSMSFTPRSVFCFSGYGRAFNGGATYLVECKNSAQTISGTTVNVSFRHKHNPHAGTTDSAIGFLIVGD